MDPFTGSGKAPGLAIWRIDNFEPVPIPEQKFGTFFEGDSYLILHTSQDTGGALSYDIYFWVGSTTSQDESTCVATHAVHLDDVLGGAAVQHREVCGKESPGFLKVFKTMKVLRGGKGSALHRVADDQYASRLVHIKLGRGAVRIAEVAVAAESLNVGDSFVLDTADVVYLWHGPEASPREKSRALDVATGIRDEDHAGSAKMVVLEGSDIVSQEAVAFYAALGVTDPASLTLSPAAEDPATAAAFEVPRLFTAASGAFTEVAAQPLKRGLLTSDGTFFLVAGGAVWAWTGKAASAESRAFASELGAQFVTQQGLPAGTFVKVTKENLEPTLFKLNFRDWPQDEMLQYVQAQKAPQLAAPQDTAALAASMLTPPPSEEVKAMFVEGGATKVWLVGGAQELTELPSKEAGQLYDSECYLVQYTYSTPGSGEAAVVYFWLGRNSSAQEQTAAAMLANNLHQTELKGRSTLVRVAQGQEPPHFQSAFSRPLIIHDGNCSDLQGARTRMFHVKGDSGRDAVAVEVAAAAANLNSGDCFVLLEEGGASCVWAGKYSSEPERHVAGEVAGVLGGEATIVGEGQEADSFWEALGGRTEYPTFSSKGALQLAPRLFQINSLGGGRLKATPIPAFGQDDLSHDDVMLLDTYNEVFVWVGAGASTSEKASAAELAKQYIAAAAPADGRSPDTAISTVQAGEEPPIFTCHFAGWDTTKAPTFVDPYEAKLLAVKEREASRQQQEEAAAPAPAPAAAAPAVAAVAPVTAAAKAAGIVEDSESASAAEAPAAAAMEEEPVVEAKPVVEEEPVVEVQPVVEEVVEPAAVSREAAAFTALATEVAADEVAADEVAQAADDVADELPEDVPADAPSVDTTAAPADFMEHASPEVEAAAAADVSAREQPLVPAALAADVADVDAAAVAAVVDDVADADVADVDAAAAADAADDVADADVAGAAAASAVADVDGEAATAAVDVDTAAGVEGADGAAVACAAAASGHLVEEADVAAQKGLAAVRTSTDAELEGAEEAQRQVAEEESARKGSVSELTRKMAMLDSERQAQQAVLHGKANGKAAEQAPVSPLAAPSTPPKAVLTAHDTKNTANVAQILSAGSFEKVPLQDFIPYSELVSLRLEDGIDVSRKEDYLDEEEFASVFGFTRDAFKGMPAWRKIQTKKKHHLF